MQIANGITRASHMNWKHRTVQHHGASQRFLRNGGFCNYKQKASCDKNSIAACGTV
jgi:hypothetical protein